MTEKTRIKVRRGRQILLLAFCIIMMLLFAVLLYHAMWL